MTFMIPNCKLESLTEILKQFGQNELFPIEGFKSFYFYASGTQCAYQCEDIFINMKQKQNSKNDDTCFDDPIAEQYRNHP